MIAGPIVRYGKLGPQLKHFYRFDPDLFRSGVLLFSIWLIKKILIADRISIRIDPILADPSRLGLLDSSIAMLGYAFQIYFDFSASPTWLWGSRACSASNCPGTSTVHTAR